MRIGLDSNPLPVWGLLRFPGRSTRFCFVLFAFFLPGYRFGIRRFWPATPVYEKFSQVFIPHKKQPIANKQNNKNRNISSTTTVTCLLATKEIRNKDTGSPVQTNEIRKTQPRRKDMTHSGTLLVGRTSHPFHFWSCSIV